MPVYVDQARNKFRRMTMSHMIADTPKELHEMALRIGMRREWFQPRSFPHYDVSLGRKYDALRYGAKEVCRKEMAAHMRRIRASGVFDDT